MRITIHLYTFHVPEPYQPGDTLTPALAQALNRLFAENIRNNVDQWVKTQASQCEAPVLEIDQLEELEAKITQYANSYQFEPGPSKFRLGPLELEESKTAGEILMSQGMLPGDTGWDEEIARLVKSRPVREEARRRLLAKMEVGIG